MKFSAASLFLFFSMVNSFVAGQNVTLDIVEVSPTNTILNIPPQQLSSMGVRILINDGQQTPPTEFCTEEELQSIVDKALALIGKRNRNLRASRHLKPCKKLCEGFTQGTCATVFPQCPGWRELVEGEEVEEFSVVEESENTDRELSQTYRARARAACDNEKEKTKAALLQEYSEVSPSCQAQLMEKIMLECVRVTD